MATVDTGSSEPWPTAPGQSSKEGALLGSPAALVDIFDTAFTSSVDRDNECGSAGNAQDSVTFNSIEFSIVLYVYDIPFFFLILFR